LTTKGTVGKVIALACLIAIYTGLAIAVAVNIMNIPNSTFNPAPPTVYEFISIDYPPTQGFLVQNNLMHISVNLTTSGSFAQGQIVNVDATGSISDAFLKNIWQIAPVYMLFYGASNYANGSISYPIAGPNFGGAKLMLNQTNRYVYSYVLGSTTLGAPRSQIVWTVEGTFYPAVVFFWRNGTSVQVTYPEFTITIRPSDVLSNARYNRINEILSVVLVVFGFVEGTKIIWELRRSSFIEPKLVDD
jgi:hypothetical protein